LQAKKGNYDLTEAEFVTIYDGRMGAGAPTKRLFRYFASSEGLMTYKDFFRLLSFFEYAKPAEILKCISSIHFHFFLCLSLFFFFLNR
jgi:hypothetical protein